MQEQEGGSRPSRRGWVPRPLRPESRRSLLLVAAILGGLLAARWAVTGGLSEPIVPSAPTEPTLAGAPPRALPGSDGTRLTFGGRQVLMLDPHAGGITRVPQPPAERVQVWRQGRFTVMVEPREEAWVVPAGQAGPRRGLGPVSTVLPAVDADQVWLVTARFGNPEQTYLLDLVELATGRRVSRRTLSYRTAPVAVVPQGVVATDLDDNLVLVDPERGRVRRLAEKAQFVDAHGSMVAWLDTDGLYLADLAGGTRRVVAPPAGAPDWLALGAEALLPAACCHRLGGFAPDGRTLAAFVRLATPSSPGLAVVDPATARAVALPGSEGVAPTDCLPCLAWSSNGWLFFFDHGEAVSSVAAWRPGDEDARSLPFDVDEQTGAVPTSLAAS
jgi:hypothetical protein